MTNAIIITYKSQLVREKSLAPMGKDQCVSVNVCVWERRHHSSCATVHHIHLKNTPAMSKQHRLSKDLGHQITRIYTDTGKLPELSQSTHWHISSRPSIHPLHMNALINRHMERSQMHMLSNLLELTERWWRKSGVFYNYMSVSLKCSAAK